MMSRNEETESAGELLDEIEVLTEDIGTYLDAELKYHQERYIQGEARAAKLATFCGTLATLLSTASIALSGRGEFVSNIPVFAKVGFVVSIALLFSAAVTALLGILPTDKFGRLTRPWRIFTWIARIDSASETLKSVGNTADGARALQTFSDVILWQDRNPEEKHESLVVRSKMMSLLAFKRSIGVRQLSAFGAITLIYLSMTFIVIIAISVFVASA